MFYIKSSSHKAGTGKRQSAGAMQVERSSAAFVLLVKPARLARLRVGAERCPQRRPVGELLLAIRGFGLPSLPLRVAVGDFSAGVAVERSA